MRHLRLRVARSGDGRREILQSGQVLAIERQRERAEQFGEPVAPSRADERHDVVAEAREFPLWMAQKLTKTARGKVASLRFMRALGDSMEPLIEPGALLLVDESDADHRRSPKPRKASDHNNIYVFLQDGALRVKRLRVDRKGATIALSDNPAYDPEFLHKQDFKVLGRVIWWDNRL